MSLPALARSAWKRPAARDRVYTPLPFARVFSAWLATVVAIRVAEAMRAEILFPSLGAGGGEVVGAVLSMAAVLAVTRPFLIPYSAQGTAALVWYGFMLAALTVFVQTLFELYVQHHFGYEILARYNILRGELWPFVVVTVAVTPFIWTRWSE